MKRIVQKAMAVVLLACLTGPVISKTSADMEIKYLIEFVGESDCTFERNGKVYDASRAADHLNLKYQRGKRYADSAEHFIDRLASQSSFSGKPYFISCPDTGRVKSKTWLHRVLVSHREERANP